MQRNHDLELTYPARIQWVDGSAAAKRYLHYLHIQASRQRNGVFPLTIRL